MAEKKKFEEEFIADTYKGKKYKKEGRMTHVIITYDLKNATSTAYKEIDEHLKNYNFIKSIRFKRASHGSSFFDRFELPKNTYAIAVKSADYKKVSELRDKAEKIIKDILELQLRWGDLDGYHYFVFTAAAWSLAAGRKYREEE